MSGMMLSTCPVCGRKAMIDVEGPRLDYGCHSVTPEEARKLRDQKEAQ